MTGQSTKASRRHHFETLEDRKMMAGDVLVELDSFDSRDLRIVGDSASNNILVEEISTDRIRVTGRSGTTINGQNSRTLTVTDDVRISLGQGHDKVEVKNLNLRNYSHSGLSVDGGEDNDEVKVDSVDVASHLHVDGGHGDDELRVLESRGRDIEVRGEYGDDFLRITGSTSYRDILAHGGEDDDTIQVSDSEASDDVLVYGDAGSDYIFLDGVFAQDDLRIDGGSNADDIDLLANESEDLYIYGGSGNDTVQAWSNQASDYFYASLGTGRDSLMLFSNSASRHYLDGGTSFDNLDAYGTNFLLWSNVRGFES